MQKIVGALLYYGRAVDNKLIVGLSSVGYQQAEATVDTAAAMYQLLDYVATYPHNSITYRSSDMILAAHADASDQNERLPCSRVGYCILLSENNPLTSFNGPILTISSIIKFFMYLASESELGALFITAKEMIPLRQTTIDMGWNKVPSSIQTDNSTAIGVFNKTIVPRRIKSMDMLFHWIR